MKLYYAPGACSLAPHIVLCESGLPFEAVRTDLQTHSLPDGSDYRRINAKGYVPLLEFDDGQRLTEGPVIVQWIADQVPALKLAPPAGSMARYRLMEWLNFISSEIHKQFSPLFNPAYPETARAINRETLRARYAWVDAQLADKPYLMGEDFTVADAYLFVVTNWAAPMQIDTAPLAHLSACMARIAQRPAVRRALHEEGLA